MHGRRTGVRVAPRPARRCRSTRVVFANELLDNLPFGIARVGRRRAGTRCASRVDGARFVEMLVPAADADVAVLDAIVRRPRPLPVGDASADPTRHRGVARRVRPRAAHAVSSCSSTTSIDIDELLARGARLAAHLPRAGRGGDPLDAPGNAGHHRRRRARAARARRARRGLHRSSATRAQADWLRDLGIDDLVADGRRAWDDGAAPRRPRRARRAQPRRRRPRRSPIRPGSAPIGSSRCVRSDRCRVRRTLGSLGRAQLDRGRERGMAERDARGTAPGGPHVPAVRAVPQGRARHRRVGLRRRRARLAGPLGARRRSRSTGSRSGTRSSSGTCRSRSGSSAASSTSRTTASTGTSKPVTATRSRSTGKASPATPARSRTPSSSTSRAASRTCSSRSASHKGDRVAIYMGMVPELPAALLACARIGAPHSVVFGGFTAASLRDRINDAEAKVLDHRRRRVAARRRSSR